MNLSQITTPLDPSVESAIAIASIGAGGFLAGREVIRLFSNRFDFSAVDEDAITIGSLMLGSGILIKNPENRIGQSFMLAGIVGGLVNLALSFRKTD
jgi:hypothetical protein